MTKPICGFFAPEGRMWEEELAHQFASRCSVEGQPLCFRVHIWERDWPEAQKARAFAASHGMRPMLSVTETQAPPLDVSYAGWAGVSVGNGHDWTTTPIGGLGDIQDDSGPVGAMKIMRHRGINGRRLLFHAYGQSGFNPGKMLPALCEEADKRGVELIWSECHWGFPGKDKNIGDRPDVTSAEAGAWCRQACVEAYRYTVPVAIYTPRFFFDRDHQPNAAGRVFFGYEGADPLKAPRMKSLKMRVDLALA